MPVHAGCGDRGGEDAVRWPEAVIAATGPLVAANDARPAGRPRPCRVLSPCLPDDLAHAAAAAIARDARREGLEDGTLRRLLRAALFDLQHRGFRVPDGLDPSLAEVCGALMEAGAGE
jgi:hypothetical protein